MHYNFARGARSLGDLELSLVCYKRCRTFLRKPDKEEIGLKRSRSPRRPGLAYYT